MWIFSYIESQVTLNYMINIKNTKEERRNPFQEEKIG